MHQDHVRLDAQLHQLCDPHIITSEMLHIRSRIIKAVILLRLLHPRKSHAAGLFLLHPLRIQSLAVSSLKRVSQRLFSVKLIELGEETEPDLVKRIVLQSFQRLLLPLHRLIRPRIAGRANRIVGRMIRIPKMRLIHHHYRSVVLPRRRHYLKGAFRILNHICKISFHLIRISTLVRRHKSRPVDTVPIVEAVNPDLFLLSLKRNRHRVIAKRIPVAFTPAADFKKSPFLYLLHKNNLLVFHL